MGELESVEKEAIIPEELESILMEAAKKPEPDDKKGLLMFLEKDLGGSKIEIEKAKESFKLVESDNEQDWVDAEEASDDDCSSSDIDLDNLPQDQAERLRLLGVDEDIIACGEPDMM